MKFLILDIYPNDDWRLVKDTAGGYGTGNDFGNSIFSKAVNFCVKNDQHATNVCFIHSLNFKK